MGFRGGSQQEVYDSIPLDVFVAIVYHIVTKNMEQEECDRFREMLFELSTGRIQERLDRAEKARIAANEEALRKLMEV